MVMKRIRDILSRVRSHPQDMSEETTPLLSVVHSHPSKAPEYRLKGDVGDFDIVGFTMVEHKTRYQLKHQATGKTFTVSKPLFELLFERKGPFT